MRHSLLALAAASLLGLASPAHAGITFNFLDGLPNSSLGNTRTFSALENSSYKVTAKGTGDLYVKTDGGDETGLGLKNTADHEITKATSIDFNFAALKLQVGDAPITFHVGSVQSGEGFKLSGFDGTLHTLFSQVDATTYTVSSSDVHKYDHFVLTAFGSDASNVLVTSVTVGAVPEPASLAMMGVGMAASLAGYRIRRRGAATA